MTDALIRACGGFLDVLGGCAVPAEGLARLADYFELDSRRVAAAAASSVPATMRSGSGR